MAVIKPFSAIRPTPEFAHRIAALPYDVYNRAEALTEVTKEPLSFLRIDRAETNFDDSVGTYDDCVYEKASEILWSMLSDGLFIQDEEPHYYIYQLIMNGRKQTGICACASVDDYINNVIRKHENTRADKEEDRIRHVDRTGAQTGPIFLAYRSNEVINHYVDETMQSDCLYDFTSDDGITHKVWRIDSLEATEAIMKAFADMQRIYIADGHHRCASAVKVGLKRRERFTNYDGTEEFNYFMSVLFPDEQLMIMDYNRVVKDLAGLSEEEFLSKMLEKYDLISEVSVTDKPTKKGELTMLLGQKAYLMKVKESFASTDPVDGLDVSVLQNEILNPVLGIKDPKTDKRIDFVGGIRGMEELSRRLSIDCKVAFAMYPTSISELFEVADAGLLMPPKSTWFEPKLRSGLFIHDIGK